MTDFNNPREVQDEPELMLARRAFAVAQAGFEGAGATIVNAGAAVTWHGTNDHPEAGATALAPMGSDLIGEVLRVTRDDGRSVHVYCVGGSILEDGADLSLSRRAFLALGLLSLELLTATVEVIE